jgi:hypothetical protein
MSHSNETDPDPRHHVFVRLTEKQAGALVELLAQSVKQTKGALDDPRFPLDARPTVRAALVQVEGAAEAVTAACKLNDRTVAVLVDRTEAVELWAVLDTVLEEAPHTDVGPTRIARIQAARRALVLALTGGIVQ